MVGADRGVGRRAEDGVGFDGKAGRGERALQGANVLPLSRPVSKILTIACDVSFWSSVIMATLLPDNHASIAERMGLGCVTAV